MINCIVFGHDLGTIHEFYERIEYVEGVVYWSTYSYRNGCSAFSRDDPFEATTDEWEQIISDTEARFERKRAKYPLSVFTLTEE